MKYTRSSIAFNCFVLSVLAGAGCKEETTIVGPKDTVNHVYIRPEEYAKNHFFVDTLYRGYYEYLHSQLVPQLTDKMLEAQILQMDVYVSLIGNVNMEPNKIRVRSYIDLPSRDENDLYTKVQIDLLSTLVGRYEYGFFKVLKQDSNYRYNAYEGTITLLTSVSEDQAVAVMYTVAGPTPWTYGGKVQGNDTVLFLKLVKPRYLSSNPSWKPAWELMLRNVYLTGGRNHTREQFNLMVVRQLPTGADEFEIEGEPLLAVLGLDRFDEDFNTWPNDAFDFIPALTIDPARGEIMFPSLRPFDSTIVRYFRGLGKPVADSFLVSSVYDTTSVAAANDVVHNKYVIEAKYAESK